ncbi:rho GTPase-activating protein 190 isoform X3 [Patella vulgata]|uniref:rho GTPase-activating protein 190 isoform X3 n=1 Tax=Patella vulgata TaxID=6465 RepID=UPI00217FC786|nr:rho GTPase-activating protein 190 isoform X3 [Patella vulgata]
MAKKAEGRMFNVAVIGPSGTDKDKGLCGVGKSFLCNRFLYQVADKYQQEHISVLSQSDFAGRVINNDHFLYWGEVTKLDDGNNYHFQLIEQTEFIDDVSFQPFKTGRTTEPYYKRCVATKVQSLEKLMYICKEQLGMENDTAYEQKLIPDGKINIDGFICCFDVSNVKDRPIEKQVDFVALILNQALKTKKPVVLAATKCDEADERYLKEAEKLLSRKEFKGSIPLVETSSQENVNVELAFMTLAHLIDKTKPRTKVIPFVEARKSRREILAVAKEAYKNLLRQHINDPKAFWGTSQKKFEKEPDFGHFVDLFGTDAAHRDFKQHVRRLREEQIKAKERKYYSQLPHILSHLLPSLDLVEDRTWSVIQRYIKQHEDSSKYFVQVCDSEEDSWKDVDKFIDSYETRLPFDLLNTPEADTCFRNQLNELQVKQRKRELQKQFKKLLEENKHVTPGKPLGETYVFFVGKDCYNGLGDLEKNAVYEEHQQDIKQKAKQEFQELLWEKSQVFLGLNSTGRLTPEHLKKINLALQDDPRYKMLQRLEEDRKVMILNHLGFIECPSKDRCYFKEQCIDSQVQKVLSNRSSRPTSQLIESVEDLDCEVKPLNLVLLGKEGVATELNREIRRICSDDEYIYQNVTYSLDYRPIDGDVSLDHNALGTANFKPHGCLCVYNSVETLEYIRSSLEQSLFSDLQREEEATMSSMQIVIIQSYKSSQSEKHREMLREEGQTLARRLHGEFVDIPEEEMEGEKSFSIKQVHQAIQSVIQQGRNSLGGWLLSDQIEPDIRIAMCMMCGDPLPVEIPLGPLLYNENCQVSRNSPNTINIDSFLDCGKQKIEIEISPNHGGGSLQQGIFHGYILVYSAKRRASLSTLQALGKRLPPVPKLIVCVADSGGAASFFTSDISQTLIKEGNALADDILYAHFMTTTANFQQQTAVYNPFFKDAWDRKEESESLYTEPVEEPSPPAYDDRSSYMDRRPPAKLPVPFDMYHTTKSSSNSQSTEDSEPIYDQPIHPNPYHSDSDRERASSTSPPPPEDIYSEVSDAVPNGEHLVRPSFVKSRRTQFAAYTKDHRKSLPILESCETKLRLCESRGPSDNETNTFTFTQLRKSSSMKLDVAEEEAWALNEPTKGSRSVLSACKQTSSSEEALGEASMYESSSQDIIWADNELYDRAQLYSPSHRLTDGWDNPSFSSSLERKRSNMQKRSQSHSSGMVGNHQSKQRGTKVTAPLAMPEPIEIADYGTVKDAVSQFSENDYASVEDALPPGKLQRIKSSVRKKEKRNTDSEDSEFSSLEREARPDRRPKVYKKPAKKVHGTSFFMSKSMTDDYQQRLGISGEATNRVRSNSPSEGSEGTGDELATTKKPVKRKSFKHKGRYTSFGVPKIFSPPDLDYQIGSPPRDNENLFNIGNPPIGYSTLPRAAHGGTASTDDGDYDLNDSGHWRSLLKGKTYRDPEKQRRKEEKKLKDDERKKQKEEEKKQKEQLKLQKKIKKKDSKGSGPSQSGCYLEDFLMSQNNPLIPVFIERCIQFIEEEGLKAEGIYRIPGNKQQVDLLITKFNENPSAEIGSLDLEIQVNAAATVLKGFFSDLTDPLIPASLYEELIEAAGVHDKSSRLLALRGVLKKLPEQNFEVLKYLMTHLNRVTQNHQYNNMDSSNLAICWWPTIMRLEFKSYENMALHTRYPVEIVMTAIEQCNFMFHGGDEV